MSEAYLMEDPREADRLAAKVDADTWVQRYLRPHVRDQTRILDVGCGPAAIAAAAARAFPTAHVTALDQSRARLAAAGAALDGIANASVTLGDVNALPFANETFDLVYCRFLLEYVADKQHAVAELARVCRHGGTVLLQDVDAQLVNHYPPDPQLEQGLAEVLRLLAATGFDPYVGRKLYQLLRGAALVDCGLHVESYHLIAGAAQPDERARWALKLDIAANALRKLGASDVEPLKTRFLDYLDREDTITFSQLFTAWARKRELPHDRLNTLE
jgi:SAM-dependent methyltransferase